jgi:hypothetical protein
MEFWKKIKGFENYEISNLGNVKSKQPFKKEKILKFRYTKFGYVRVMLAGKKEILVHRLVANAFLENKENKPEVNHKNLIKDDNRLENLEWATKSENITHSFNNNRNKKHKEILRYRDMELKTYHSILEASLDNNVTTCAISNCLAGKSKTSNGYKWKYLENDKKGN